MQTVFYSWQSDLPNATNRGFIEDCLERAIEELHAEEKIRVFEPDRDIQGTSGSPDIADTIFDKIDRCAAFVADVSFINGMEREQPEDDSELPPCSCTRLTPNPNVLVEWGRASSKSPDFDRVITVLNTVTGRVEDLPFDVRKRGVQTYSLKKGEDKKDARKMLVGKLKSALRAILALPDAQLDLQFVDSENGVLGQSIAIEGTAIVIDFEKIPSCGSNDTGMFGGIQNAMTNREYWRDLATYRFHQHLFHPVRLRLKNTGTKLLRNVRLEADIQMAGEERVFVMEQHEMPSRPSSQRLGFVTPDVVSGIRSVYKYPGELDVTGSRGKFHLEVRFLDVQAQAAVSSEHFFVGSLYPGKITLNGFLFADELSAPIQISLAIDFTPIRQEMTVDQLIESDKEDEGGDE